MGKRVNKIKVHKSHISSKEANIRGWSRVPSPAIREETLNLSKEVGIDYMVGNYLVLTADTTSSTTNSSSSYLPIQTWGNLWSDGGNTYWDYPQSPTKEVTKEMEKRTLFEVYVVDPRGNGKILLDGKKVIALNENQAMLKAGVADIAEKENLELEQVDVYVRCVGTFIRPRKETQKVRITKEEED